MRVLEPRRPLLPEELLLTLVGHVAADEGSAHAGEETERRSDNRRPPLEHCPPPTTPEECDSPDYREPTRATQPPQVRQPRSADCSE